MINFSFFFSVIIYRVEDTDDLVPLFNKQNDRLKSNYGDFFLAELVEAQDEHMQCLVAEVSLHGMNYIFKMVISSMMSLPESFFLNQEVCM